MRRFHLALRPLLLTVLFVTAQAHGRTFHAEGSDLLIGVGASQMAQGGAAVAATDDLYSLFWNPAGLAEMRSSQLSASRQLNATLSPLNFLGIGLRSERLNFRGLRSTLAFAIIPRLHTASTGHYLADDLESMFLRYALPGLPADFDGRIESKTRDYRLSWAFAPEHSPSWSAAISVSHIECGTTFCGVTADDPGNYTSSSSSATANSLHLGAKYFVNERFTLGLNIEDIKTRLRVKVVTTDSSGTVRETYTVPLPRDITFGMAWRASPHNRLSLDYQQINGSYGNYDIDARLLRGGINHRYRDYDLRGGLILPLTLRSEQIGDIKKRLSYPLLPTVGAGWQSNRLRADLVLYPHALMSHHQHSLSPAADLTLIYLF